jgi:hypothetical protein
LHLLKTFILFFYFFILGNIGQNKNDYYIDYSTQMQCYVIDDEYEVAADEIEADGFEYIAIDEFRIVRRAEQVVHSFFINNSVDYLNFLQSIFSVVPNRGAPYENTIAIQSFWSIYLYLHHLF